MGSRPIIGITTYAPRGDPPAFTLPAAYVRAVVLAGGTPLLIAPTAGAPDGILERVDGVVLSGGGDVDPALHRGGEHPAVYGVSRERDEFEIALVRRVLERPELPLLGICRGMQVLNVALGGDLELHIPDRRGEAVPHRLPPGGARVAVSFVPDAPFEEIYGERELEVCCWHHQEVGRLGAGLRAMGHAPDGVIEALVFDGHPSALAVQWHPEEQVEEEPVQRRLFEWLVERARSRR